MEILGHLLTVIVAGTITAGILPVALAGAYINHKLMKKK